MKKTRNKLEMAELAAILERARGVLSDEDHAMLTSAVDTLAILSHELEAKGASIQRLRRLLFGPSTEKTSRVLGLETAGVVVADKVQEKRPGHGRNGVAAYTGAERVKVAHESLTHGAGCLACARGKVYKQRSPATLLRVSGLAPLQASIYELETLRCNLCGQVFTARAPAGVGTAKYDESAVAMIALLKYGCGLPFNRLEKLQKSLGIPLPAATQWEVVHEGSRLLEPAYRELVRQGAQGEVIHNDDTTMKILALEAPQPENGSAERRGVYTSGIVSRVDGHQIALFFTGRKHAGENLQDVLAQREQERPAPIQMCDALSSNTSGDFDTIIANCMAHARRQFVDVATSFPDECRHVLETLRDVYRNDDVTRKQAMSPAARLAFHQQHSKPLMDELKEWLREQIDEHRVEPNSGLGQAIAYMRKHWDRLTLFLNREGAPLDNTICERALKKVILHRKNALFYRTETGARVGDLFMTLIHTAELCHADPFDYLIALLRHAEEVPRSPGDWMPWNYQAARDRLAPAPPG
jgi:transposase